MKYQTMPDVKELLQILIENNQQQAAQSVVFMMNFMDSMEEQLQSVNQGLQAVRKELTGLQQHTPENTMKVRLSELIKGLEEKVHQLQEQITQMKVKLNHKANQVIRDFKKRGAAALGNVTKALGIAAVLSALNKSFEQGFANMDQGIAKINDIEQTYREAVGRVKNAGRVLVGKEIEKEVVYPEKGLFAALRKPFQSMKNVYALGGAETKRAFTKVTQIEKSGEQAKTGKKSISQRLKELKEKQENKEAVQPTKMKGKEQEYGR